MELLFGFRGAGPQKGHHRREVEGWAGQTGTDEDTGAGWQGCMAHTTHISSNKQHRTVPRGESLWRKKKVKLSGSHNLNTNDVVFNIRQIICIASENESGTNLMRRHAVTCCFL